MASAVLRTAAMTLLIGAAVQAQSPAAAKALPERLTDAEFWKLVSDISEPNDYFQIEDNFTSNEPEIGRLFAMLQQRGVKGGVYLGVGPEQNFTYIAAIRPKMAFICDIRRQAVMHHLMYKAMFELAKDRADFISILFGLPRPAGLDSATSIDAIWQAYATVTRDTTLSAKNYERVVDRLVNMHKFTFTPDETAKLKHVFDSFQWYGPAITTQSGTGRGGNTANFVTLTSRSYDTTGVARSFLSTEDNYRYIKSLHEKNLIVAVSGDFGKTKALRGIADYLRERGATVSAFYVSNVEQYLFRSRTDSVFYQNVATFPVDSASVFIRPYSLRGFRGGIMGDPAGSLCPIAPFLGFVKAGRLFDYNQVLSCPR